MGALNELDVCMIRYEVGSDRVVYYERQDLMSGNAQTGGYLAPVSRCIWPVRLVQSPQLCTLLIYKELLEGRVYDAKADMYSLGCLLHEMCILAYVSLAPMISAGAG